MLQGGAGLGPPGDGETFCSWGTAHSPDPRPHPCQRFSVIHICGTARWGTPPPPLAQVRPPWRVPPVSTPGWWQQPISQLQAGQRFPDQLAPVCRLPSVPRAPIPAFCRAEERDPCGLWASCVSVLGRGPPGRDGPAGPAGRGCSGGGLAGVPRPPAPPVTDTHTGSSHKR